MSSLSEVPLRLWFEIEEEKREGVTFYSLRCARAIHGQQ